MRKLQDKHFKTNEAQSTSWEDKAVKKPAAA